VKNRQDGPHAHAVVFSADNRFAFVAISGWTRFSVQRRQGTFAPYNPPVAAVSPGSGPRHPAFHPNGKFLYANNESTQP
jgi:6-phosphogluconolactonase (cycloisomerase 2 family)